MSNHNKVIKYCPKCGSSDFFPDSPKSYLCKKCRFHFYLNSAAAVVALVFNEKGEVAHEPNKGALDLPGGFVDPGESVEKALFREVYEELNVEITNAEYLVSFPNEYPFSGLTVNTTDLAFICTVKTLDTIRAGDDVSGYRFVDVNDIDYLKIFSASIRNILKHYKENC